jgi:hypothetical protein
LLIDVTYPNSAPAVQLPTDAPTPTLQERRRSDRLTILWILNFLAVAALAVWIVGDRTAGQLLSIAAPAPDTTWFPAVNASAARSRGAAARAGVAMGLAGFGVISLFIFAVGLLVGPRLQRGLRSWLALTALVAMWAGLVASADDLTWTGERWRMRWQIPMFDSLAARLRTEFPVRDGRLAELGNFTAYPVGRPQMLLMFIVETPPGRATVAAVERSPAGALRFALASEQRGQWLEWHPAGSEPASFKGTLAEYTLERAAALGDGWHLTRYQ